MIPESLRLKAEELRSKIEAMDFRLRADALWFSAFGRADYYRFLADMIEGTQGTKPLIRIFQDDATRFAGAARGRLSARWARQFARGGNLARTFSKTLPAADIEVIATAQEQGDEDALQQALRELADNTDLQRKALSIVISTLLASLFSLVALLAMVLLTPGVMVPRLQSAFSLVPPEDWPAIAAKLFRFAEVIDASWLMISMLSIALVAGCFWSLGSLTGPARLFFDRYGLIWGMYRDFQSIRTLSSLATAVSQKTAAKGLREGLAMQVPGASRWKRHHLEQMLAYVDSGTDNSLIFTTGTLDTDTAWYLQDLIESRGMEDALAFVKTRLETRVIKKLSVQSLVISWVLILGVIAAATGLMLWIYAAIDALSAALQNQFY